MWRGRERRVYGPVESGSLKTVPEHLLGCGTGEEPGECDVEGEGGREEKGWALGMLGLSLGDCRKLIVSTVTRF